MWARILDNYEVSDSGMVRNARTGRYIRQFVGRDGYLRTQIAGKTRTVHRLIAHAFVPADWGKDVVNHKDGNKQNNNADNLEWVTSSENAAHAYMMNLKERPIGEKNGRSRLTEADVRFIRANYVPGSATYGAKALSQRFGVAPQTISAAARGQRWKHNITGEQ